MDDQAAWRAEAAERLQAQPAKMQVRDLSLWYGDKRALTDVTFDLVTGEALAFIGPSGCGKTTALKCLNRMHEGQRDVRVAGTILMDGQDIHDPEIDVSELRRRFGWVAQKPNPFPLSIYDNVAYGPHLHGLVRDRAETDAWVEQCLRRADLWDEVKDGLHTMEGTDLSGGQQQRLCVARALSLRPEVLLMDEPTGSIDPIATHRIEDLLLQLKGSLSIVVITHSMAEARRVSDRVAFFHLGELLEIGPTEQVFTTPRNPRCRDFVAGRYG